jgi:hypothetical protein
VFKLTSFKERNVFVQIIVVQIDVVQILGTRPDGFTSAFYKISSHVIWEDILAALDARLHGDGREFGRLNNALVVLLGTLGCNPK